MRAQAEVKIAPHKAIYAMSLGHVKNGINLQNFSGTMLFDWQDTCDGWAIQQRSQFVFLYSDGQESRVDGSMMTWESKDGQTFTFYNKRTSNDIEDEVFKGETHREKGKESRVHFSLPPETPDLMLTEETLFPTQHALLLIEKAQAGEKIFSKDYFDGSQSSGVDIVSAFIGAKRETVLKGEVKAGIEENVLLKSPVWPIRLAFYDKKSQASVPEYEMDVAMQANGVSRRIEIDYGDFSIVGTLEKIEPSTSLSCEKDKK